MPERTASGDEARRGKLVQLLADAFVPAVEGLEAAFAALMQAVGDSGADAYAADLEKLAGSIERMREKSRWTDGFIRADAPAADRAAATIRHDLRTPMSGVLGYAELLLEEMADNGDPRFVDAVGAVVTAANLVLKEISNLLFALDESGEREATLGPRAEEGEGLAAAAAAPADSRRGETGGRILVVDDNASIRELVTRRLQRLGHSVTACSSGEDALALTATEAFDLVMLDLLMPGLSGVEVLHRLKRQPRSAAIPVIVMSALDEVDAAVRCIEAGADDYLSKPLNATLLTARIDTLLERKFLRDREQATLARLREEQMRADMLLHNIFPASVVRRLGAGEKIIADHFTDVAVLFCDLVGFTQLASTLSPIATLKMLNDIFSGFDALAEKNGVEKIKTVGDAYLLVAGIPDPVSDPAFRVATMAREMGGVLRTVAHGENLQLRIGISKGPAAAGVVGTRKLFYDVWGHTVNLASRLESVCEPGRILVSSGVEAALAGRVAFERNDPVVVRGLGAIDTYYLR